MKAHTLVLVLLIAAAAMTRLLPHPPNFTAIDALAVFAAARHRNRLVALLAPLAAMLLGDLGLEAASRLGLLRGWMGGGTGFYSGMWIVYLAVVLVGCVGLLLRRRPSIARTAGCVLTGSVVFFLVTNFAWWACYDLYPHTGAGLAAGYVAALPFLPWSLAGDAFYATVFFAGFALAQKHYPALQPATGG